MNKSNWTGTTFAEDLWGQLATYLVSLLIDSSDFFDRQMVFVKTKEMEAIVPSEKFHMGKELKQYGDARLCSLPYDSAP